MRSISFFALRASEYDWKSVDPDRLERNLTCLVTETSRHPAGFGYYLRDEPGAELFAGLALAARKIRELAPGAWP